MAYKFNNCLLHEVQEKLHGEDKHEASHSTSSWDLHHINCNSEALLREIPRVKIFREAQDAM